MRNDLCQKLKDKRIKKVARLKEEKWKDVIHEGKLCLPITLKVLQRHMSKPREARDLRGTNGRGQRLVCPFKSRA